MSRMKWIPSTLLAIVATLSSSCQPKEGSESATLREFTAAPSKVVWVRDVSDEGSDTFLSGAEHQLVGMSSEEPGVEKMILSEVANYSRPLLTSDGRRVVYSQKKLTGEFFKIGPTEHEKMESSIWVVDWDGAGTKRLAEGYASDLWRDPASGRDWVIAGQALNFFQVIFAERIVRFPLDAPDQIEIIWEKPYMAMDSFQLSADGTTASAMHPWPHTGLADLTDQSWQKFGRGCWTSLSPDDHRLLWIFQSDHRSLRLFTPDGEKKWKVRINDAPGIDGYEVYHPRWSNHSRYFVSTGPYSASHGPNHIYDGGKQVEVLLGRFDPTISFVEQWFQLTTNDHPDFYPDLWIADAPKGRALDLEHLGSQRAPIAPSPIIAKKLDRWPLCTDQLVFLWENAEAESKIPTVGGDLQCVLKPHNLSNFSHKNKFQLIDNYLVAEAKINRFITRHCRENNAFSLELTLTSAASQPSALGRIIALSLDDKEYNFALSQRGNTLLWQIRTLATARENLVEPVEIASIEPGVPTHLVITYRPGRLNAYLNGQPVPLQGKVSDRLSNWIPQKLIVGDEWGGGYDWAGTIEGVAISARELKAAEVAERFRSYRDE